MILPACYLPRRTGVLKVKTEFRDENDTQLADGVNPWVGGGQVETGWEMVDSKSARQRFGSLLPLTCERVTPYSPLKLDVGKGLASQ